VKRHGSMLACDREENEQDPVAKLTPERDQSHQRRLGRKTEARGGTLPDLTGKTKIRERFRVAATLYAGGRKIHDVLE
jgi:hypothetical protein